jgi:protein SCO1/2
MHRAFRFSVAVFLIAAAVLAVVPYDAKAATQPRVALDEKAALRVSQAAVGRTLSDHVFRDTERKAVRLADFRGKPLVVNFVYTSCYHTCPLVVQTLAHAVEVAQDALGVDGFNVVTIGFDARDDTPSRMRAYARDRGIDLPNWRFLSADAATIDALAAEIGFLYYPSPRGFDHLAQTTVVDPAGVIYRQIYGSDFGPQTLVEPLKRMAYGMAGSGTSLASVVTRIRLFCTVYDPSRGRYRFDYSIVVGGTIGAASLAAVGFVLFRAWRRQRTAGKVRPQ